MEERRSDGPKGELELTLPSLARSLPTTIMPPEAALRPSPPISDLLKGHSYFFAASKEAKQSFDFDALVVSIRRHGGKVETRPSAGLARYLITDITDEDRLAKLIGNQVLVSLVIFFDA